MAKILILDIETAPMLVYTFDLFDQNIGINQIKEDGYILSWAAKWDGDDKIHYMSVRDGRKKMIKGMHKLLDEADIVVHFYGSRFDVPHLNSEFLLNGLPPPSPYKQVDMKLKVQQKFKFPSYKLQYVARRFGIGKKVEHEGFDLWLKVMDGDKDAWKRFQAYNIHDVVLTEGVYHKMLGYIDGHPNMGMYTDCPDMHCTNCGDSDFQRRGFHRTTVGKYQRYQCKGCGKYTHDGKNLAKGKKVMRGI